MSRTTHKTPWLWRALIGGIASLLLLAGTASAANVVLEPARQHGRTLVFELDGIDPDTIRAAYLKSNGRRQKVSLKRLRRAARRGVLKLRPRHKPRHRKRASRSAKRGAVLVLVVTDPVATEPSSGAVTTSSVQTFTAGADAYVSVNKKTRNYGSSSELRAEGSPETRSYVRFDVSGLVDPVARATLKLYARDGSSTGFELRGVADNRWVEGALTFATAPAVGPVAKTSGAYSLGQWIALDVTSLVAGNGSFSFALTSPATRPVTLSSRESGAQAPQLAVETSSPLIPPPPLPPPPNLAPAASFSISPNPAYIGQTVSFNGSGSGDPDGSIVRYQWDLDGDGSLETDTGSSPFASKAFTSPTNRTLKLRVTDDKGATGETTRTMYLSSPPSTNQSPTASFTISPNPGLTGQTVTFNGSGSSDPDGTIARYQWDLDGDGSLEKDSGSSSTVTRVFSTATSRVIKLRVTDDKGATGETTRTLTLSLPPLVNLPPSASFTASPNPAQTGQTVTFNGSGSSDPDGSIANYKWDLDGNGSFETDTGSSATTTRSYSSAASLTTRLRVTDNAGASADASRSLTVAAPPPGGQVTYYVDSTAGSDSNSGTSEALAWKTLAKASSAALNPGDRLLLARGGSWNGSLNLTRSGTSSSPIVVSSYGSGSLPLIQGACVAVRGSYLTVRELQVDNCSWAGFDVYGADNRIERNVMTHSIAGAFVKPGAQRNAIVSNEIRDNNRMSVLTSGGDDDSGAFGVLLQGDRTEVAYNTISGHDAFSYDYGRDGGAVEVYGAQYSHVHHNMAVDNDAFTELGDSRSLDNKFSYNVVRSSLASSTFLVTRGAGSGFGPVQGTQLYNNTVRLTGSSSQGFVCHAGCSASILKMRNTVIEAVLKVGYADAPFDEDNDLFFGGIVQFAKGANSIVADPQFANPGAGDLHLKATSPAIDRGINSGYGADYDGAAVPKDGNGDGTAAFDIGAYEAPAGVAANLPPTASFTASPNPAQTGQTVTFNGSGSSDPDGSIANYKWDLDGNGSFETDTGSSATTTRSYSSAASLTIRLRVTDNAGAGGEASRSLTVQAPTSTADPVIAAAGDIACPGVCGQDETSTLIRNMNPTAVLGLGDYQYDTGTLSNFNSYYEPYWGQFKNKTHAINGGSHDFYGTGDYLTYFNSGGPRTLRAEESYSFDIGDWHVIALNSYCNERSSCDENYWENWLRTDLASHSNRCTLAYWHQPYWTSPASHQPKASLKPWVQVLYDGGADVLLQAHNHGYERFHPQNPDNVRDDARGIRAFTAGTGGRSHYGYSGTASNSVVKNDDTFGALKMVLRTDGYDWQFVPEPGKTLSDAGSASCH